MNLAGLKSSAIDREYFRTRLLMMMGRSVAEIEAELVEMKDRQLASLAIVLSEIDAPQDGGTSFAEVLQTLCKEEAEARFLARQFVKSDFNEEVKP